MNPKTVQKYLMEQVNVDLVDKFKFTKETSQEFVKYFSSNFIEIEDYCQSNVTVDKFIGIRRGEQVNKVKKFFKETPGFDPLSALADPYVIPPIEHLKDCILEMMMKDGVLSLDNVLPNVDNHHLSIDEQELKYNLILKLINWNIFKWQSVTKNDKSKMSIFESSKNHLLNLTALTGATIINGVKDSIKMTEEKINEKLSVLNNASTEVSDVKSRDINVDEIKERDVITTNVFDNYNNDTVLPNSNYVKEPINDNHYYNDNNYYYHDYTNSQSITPVNEWKDYIPPTVPVKNDFMTSFGYDNRYSHNEIWESEKNQRELLKIKKKDHPYELTYYNIFIKEHLENWFNSIL